MDDHQMQEVNINSMGHSNTNVGSVSNANVNQDNAKPNPDSSASASLSISFEDLNNVMDILLNSSKDVLGNITSIGVKYGDKPSAPDHMMVIFSDELVGFESWNNRQKKCRWRYNKSTKTLQKNGAQVTSDMNQPFMHFVQQGLDAVQSNNVEFSKNITKDELKKI